MEKPTTNPSSPIIRDELPLATEIPDDKESNDTAAQNTLNPSGPNTGPTGPSDIPASHSSTYEANSVAAPHIYFLEDAVVIEQNEYHAAHVTPDIAKAPRGLNAARRHPQASAWRKAYEKERLAHQSFGTPQQGL